MPFPLSPAPAWYSNFDWFYTGQPRNGVFYPGDTVRLLRPLPAATLNGLQKYATFETGANGATVTTARQEASPITCQWNTIVGTPKYDNTHAAHGALSALIDGTTSCNTQWTRAQAADMYGRLYLYAGSNPSSGVATVFVGGQVQIRINSSGQISFASTGVAGKVFTTPIQLNAWNRIEFHVLWDGSNGTIDVKLFAGDSLTAIEEQSLTGLNTGSIPASVSFGGVAGGGLSGWGSNFWLDDLAANLTTWPGPYANETPALETLGYEAIDTLTGTVVSSGTYQGEYFTPATPAGGWLYGCYRVEVTGSNTDALFGPSYGATNITLKRSNAHWPAMPSPSVPANNGNGEDPDFPMFGVMGLGTERLIIDHADAPTTGVNTLSIAEADAALGATWWQNPGSPYADSARPRYMWCAFPNGAFDRLYVSTFIQVYCKDGTVDGSKVFITATHGTGSTTTITVAYPNAVTIVETYPNLPTQAAAVTAINIASAYIISFGYQSNAQVSMPSTAIGNAFFNGVAQVVAALFPLGVTRFEGPINEPPVNIATVHQQRLFQAAVQTTVGAKAIGPSVLAAAALIEMLDLGVGPYCDELSWHNYHSGTTGAISEMSHNLQAIKAAKAANGQTGKPTWVTEGTNGPTVVEGTSGVYHPRRAADEIGQLIFYEQYDTPKELQGPWYGISHGSWDNPYWHEAGDSSLEPQALLASILAEEIWGMTYQSALDFGTPGNQIFYGNVYSNGTTGVAVIVPASYLDSSQVTLAVSGAGATLVSVDGCGNPTTLPVVGGQVTVPLQDRPAYLRLPAGVTVTGVTSCLDWGTINLSESISPYAATKTLGGATPPLIGAVSAIADNAWLSDYASAAGIVASGVVINDGVNPPTSDEVVLGWTVPQKISRIVIWSGLVWQLYPGLVKATIDLSTDNGATWTTVYTLNKPTPTAPLFGTNSGQEAARYETFMDEQWIFNCTLARTYTGINMFRLHVTETTWGGEATYDSFLSGQGTQQRISLQEIGIYGPDGPTLPPVTSVAPGGLTVSVTPGGGSYQWRRNGANIAGANGPTYTYQPGDLENTIDVLVDGVVSTGVAQTARGNSWSRSVQPGFGSSTLSEQEPTLLLDAAGLNYLLYTTVTNIGFTGTYMGLRTCPVGLDPTNPVNWSALTKVLGSGGSGYSTGVQESNVVLVGGIYYCYFAPSTGTNANDLMVSTSTDGITWGTPTVAIAHNQAAWINRWANTAVFKDGSGNWHMLVEGFTTNLSTNWWYTSYATSTDGLTFTVQGTGPLLSLVPFAGAGAGGPSFANNGVPINGVYVVFYHAGKTDGEIWAASSPDLVNWTVLGRQLLPTGEDTEQLAVTDPSVVEQGGMLYMATSGLDSNGLDGYVNFQKFAGSAATFLGLSVPAAIQRELVGSVPI